MLEVFPSRGGKGVLRKGLCVQGEVEGNLDVRWAGEESVGKQSAPGPEISSAL